MKDEKKEEHTTPKRGFFKNLKSTYKYAKNGKKYLFLFLLTNVFLTIISVIIPILIAKRLVSLTNNMYPRLLFLISAIFWIEISRNIIRYLSNYAYNKFYYDVRKNLQLELAAETLRITQKDLNTNSSGIFIERINSDTDNLTDMFTEMIDYFTAIIGNFGILVSVFIINIWIGIAYIIFIGIMILAHKLTSNVNYKNRKEWKASKDKTGGFISEIVRGSKDIKILDAEKSFLKKADEYIDETNKVSYKYQRV